MRKSYWYRPTTLLTGLVCLLSLLRVLAGQPAEPPEFVRFAVIGDSGTGDEHQYVIAEQMERWHDRLPFELVLMLGDNIYGGFFGMGGGDQDDFEEKFDRPYAGLLERGVIFRAALGNHDMKTRDGLDEVEAYDRFHIERPEGYYRFTAGEWLPAAGAAGLSEEKEMAALVEFFVINTIRLEKDKEDPEQLAWLEEALANSRARWRIVYGHHPLYSAAKRHGSDVALRQKLEPILLGAEQSRSPAAEAAGLNEKEEGGAPGVHVVLAGHDHLYQRFHPRKGIAYFVCGSSGKLRRGDARESAWVAAVEDELRAFMLWEATPEELRYRAINERGEAFDCGRLEAAGELEPVACESLTAAPD